MRPKSDSRGHAQTPRSSSSEKNLISTILSDIVALPLSAPVKDQCNEHCISRYFQIVPQSMDLDNIKKILYTYTCLFIKSVK